MSFCAEFGSFQGNGWSACTESLASGMATISDPRLMSQVGRVRIDVSHNAKTF